MHEVFVSFTRDYGFQPIPFQDLWVEVPFQRFAYAKNGDSPQAPRGNGRTLTDEAGVVRDEVKHILDLIAEADAVVSGGHHHARELFPFYEEAKARGVRRLFLNHPTYVNDCSFQDITSLVGLGVKMEHSACMFVESTFKMFDSEHLKSVIDAAGVENTFFGTDLGQMNNPSPAEGMRMMIQLLIDLGYSDDDIRKMTATVAADLAGLDA